jgi:hypothetical protein
MLEIIIGSATGKGFYGTVNHVTMILEFDGRRAVLFEGASPDAPLVVLNTVHGEGGSIVDALRGITGRDASILCIEGLDWNDDMSPWSMPAVGKGDGFGGRADAYLKTLTGTIVPEALSESGLEPRFRAIAGYSMAGLFAVYSVYRTDMFSRVASASGSLWFPGFTDFMARSRPVRVPERVYLSLGDKEAKTRNAIMASVQNRTDTVRSRFEGMGSETIYESNPGNHLRDVPLRMAKGIAAILRPPSLLAEPLANHVGHVADDEHHDGAYGHGGDDEGPVVEADHGDEGGCPSRRVDDVEDDHEGNRQGDGQCRGVPEASQQSAQGHAHDGGHYMAADDVLDPGRGALGHGEYHNGGRSEGGHEQRGVALE